MRDLAEASSYGAWLQVERERLRLTHEAFARRAGLPTQVIYLLEIGRRTPHAGEIGGLARALGREPEALLPPGLRATWLSAAERFARSLTDDGEGADGWQVQLVAPDGAVAGRLLIDHHPALPPTVRTFGTPPPVRCAGCARPLPAPPPDDATEALCHRCMAVRRDADFWAGFNRTRAYVDAADAATTRYKNAPPEEAAACWAELMALTEAYLADEARAAASPATATVKTLAVAGGA